MLILESILVFFYFLSPGGESQRFWSRSAAREDYWSNRLEWRTDVPHEVVGLHCQFKRIH